ncbi:winged helix-turn-helix domain-containing protein [Roseateles sp. SL47]|uniref:ATP-binding protein n=1 Tax=Roseateles sp. SL47 TaxID=2995138 RepID=UPI002270F3C0|nr:winged helix-turn-helix domain-containing protein [Roseateles sp. SL47]WAC71896.1 winged helix-turn-helix domain-containing protein [Roseateles sp. SL47]
MSAPAAPPSALQYRFGDFKLLPAERLLVRRGVAVPLTARAFRLLVELVSHGGRLLSKDELMQRIWPGVVVEDNNLAVQIAALRKALGPQSIVTIAGCGYRFALEVAQISADPVPVSSRPGQLPRRMPALVGRREELAAAVRLLTDVPLLTLCGEAGVGKTRLAQAAAFAAREGFVDGAWWIDLAALPAYAERHRGATPTRDEHSGAGAIVADIIGRTLGLHLPESGDRLAALASRLAVASLLLVLDNAEHVIDDVGRVAETLVRATPGVVILVTSQQPLRVDAERVMRLAALPVADAVALLAARARTGPQADADVDVATVWLGEEADLAERICRRLDCNPLAIQLAAARLHALGLEGLEARLPQRLSLLAPGEAVLATRRNALAAALAWSCELLSDRERVVLRRLSVFPASFSMEAASLSLADDLLPAARVIETVLALVDRSLIHVETATPRRLRLLETMRLYAHEQLEAAGETPAMRVRWCAGLRWLLDEAYEEYWRLPHAAWRARYEPELATLWTLLDAALAHCPEQAVALFGSSWPVWVLAPSLERARAVAQCLLPLAEEQPEAVVRARFWEAMARAHAVDHPAIAREAASQAAALYRALGDPRGEYLAQVELAFNWRVDGAGARDAMAAARALEDPRWPAVVLERGWSTEATLLTSAGDHDGARRVFEAVVEVCERDGHESGIVRALVNLADLARAAGHIDEAVAQGQALRQRLASLPPSALYANVQSNLIGALLEQGDGPSARGVADECGRRLGPLLFDACLWSSLDTLGRLFLVEGDLETAARLAGASDRALRMHGQEARQPNEARDRSMLDAGLVKTLGGPAFAALRAEGERMDETKALCLAFGVTGRRH